MSYIREGYCSQCGQCCRAFFISKKMVTQNNVIDGELYCDFVEKRIDGKFYCLLVEKLKLINPDIDIGSTVSKELVTTEMKEAISMDNEQADWCVGELAYPDPTREEHNPTRHNIKEKHPKCTYKMVEE